VQLDQSISVLFVIGQLDRSIGGRVV